MNSNETEQWRIKLSMIRSALGSYHEFMSFISDKHNDYLIWHNTLLHSDVEYKQLCFKNNHIQSYAVSSNSNNVPLQQVAVGPCYDESSIASKRKSKLRDRKIKRDCWVDCTHNCGMKCLFTIKFSFMQNICRDHWLALERKHVCCTFQCAAWQYNNVNQNGQGVQLWFEIAQQVYYSDPELLKQTIAMYRSNLDIPIIMESMAKYLHTQYQAAQYEVFQHNKHFTQVMIWMIKHLVEQSDLAASKRLSKEIQAQISGQTIQQSLATQPAIIQNQTTVIPSNAHCQIADTTLAVQHHPVIDRTNVDVEQSTLAASTEICFNSDTDTDTESVLSSGIITRSNSSRSSTTAVSDTSSVNSSSTLANVRKQLTITTSQPLITSYNIIKSVSQIDAPTIDMYKLALQQYSELHDQIYGFTDVCAPIRNKSNNKQITQLREELLQGCMVKYKSISQRVYHNVFDILEYRGMELVLCLSMVLACEAIGKDHLNETARCMLADMLSQFDVNQHHLFDIDHNIKCVKKQDIPNHLIECSYLLFVLKQLLSPAHSKLLSWLFHWNRGRLVPLLSKTYCTTGISQLSQRVAKYSLFQITGIRSIDTFSVTPLTQSCLSTATSAICKIAILQSLQCNTFNDVASVTAEHFDDIINAVMTKITAKRIKAKQLSVSTAEWQGYFAAHVIFAVTLYGTVSIGRNAEKYVHVVDFMKQRMHYFVQIGHTEVVGELVTALRLSNCTETDTNSNILLGVLSIMSSITDSHEAKADASIAERQGKANNFDLHVQWCATRAMIPTVKQ